MTNLYLVKMYKEKMRSETATTPPTDAVKIVVTACLSLIMIRLSMGIIHLFIVTSVCPPQSLEPPQPSQT